MGAPESSPPRRMRPGIQRSHQIVPERQTTAPGPEESKEETQCQKKIQEERPTRAHQFKHLNQAQLSVPVADARKADLAAGQPADPVVAESSSAAKRSASSAPRKLTRSLTATSACCKVLWPSAARLFRVGFPAFALRTSAA